MSQITVESSINPPPYVPPKLTYEEFLHAYDGRYAEFVDSEVISPDSIIRDTQDKFEEYEAAGVAEYWIVDPSRRTANFYGLGPEGRYRQLLLTEDGRFESRTIPALWIDPTWLWQDELPTVLSIVKLWQLQ